MFMGDFNVATSDKAMEDFCSLNDLESLISNQHITKIMRIRFVTCVDLILTKRPGYFPYSGVFETGISDFHLLIVTQLKIGFEKELPEIITYPGYKKTLTMLNFVVMLITSL